MCVSEASASALEARKVVAKPEQRAFNSALVHLAFLGQDVERNQIYSDASSALQNRKLIAAPDQGHLGLRIEAADYGQVLAAGVRDVGEVGPRLALAAFGWHGPGMDTRDEAVRQEDGRSDRRRVVVTDDGAVSTLGRASDPTTEELAKVEETLVARAIGGWLAVQSHSFHRGPPPPTFVAVRRLAAEGLSFEEAVVAAFTRRGM